MDARTQLSDGKNDENLTPLESIDVEKCNTVDEIVVAMSKTSFGGRQLAKATDVLYEMVTDPDCYVVMTLSGAMTVAKQGLSMCNMIDKGMVNAIVSTGALMAHGFVESAGMTHFKQKVEKDDKELFEKGYNRVYDTIELEQNLDDAEEIVCAVLDQWVIDEPDGILSSWKFNELLGKYLLENIPGKGVLKSAYEKKVPVYVPAFTDSEFGLDVAIYNMKQQQKEEKTIQFDPFIDLNDYTNRINQTKTRGIFTIGGGVPRNWAQQVGPYLDIIEKRIGGGFGGFKPFTYGVRICPEPVHWGGLSGCTYKEGISWGKFVPEEEGGMYAEVMSDATIAWPFVLRAVIERANKGKE